MSSCHTELSSRDPGMLSNRADLKQEPSAMEQSRATSEPHTPSMTAKSMQAEPDSPSSSHMAGDSVVGFGSADGMKTSNDVPDRIDVVCGSLRGTFLVSRGKIVVDGHTDCPKEVAPTEFERLGGRAATKKWKRSIRVVTEDGAPGKPVGDWLLSYGLDIRANTLMPAADTLRAANQYNDYDNYGNTSKAKRARMSPVLEAYPQSPYAATPRMPSCSGLAQRVEALVVLGEYLNGRRRDVPLELLDISEPPQICGFDLPLGSLFSLVTEQGGYDVVTRNGLWQEVAYALGLTHGNSMRSAYLLRSAYQRFLLRYERFQSAWNEFLATSPAGNSLNLDPQFETCDDYCEAPEDVDAFNSCGYGQRFQGGFQDGVGPSAGPPRPRQYSQPTMFDPSTPASGSFRSLGPDPLDVRAGGMDDARLGPGESVPLSFLPPARCLDERMKEPYGRLGSKLDPSSRMHVYTSSPELMGSASHRYSESDAPLPPVKPLNPFLSPAPPATPSTLLSKPLSGPYPSPPSCATSPVVSNQHSDMPEPLPQSSGICGAVPAPVPGGRIVHSGMKHNTNGLHTSPDLPTGTTTSYSSSSEQSQFYPRSPTWDSPPLSNPRAGMPGQPPSSGNMQSVHVHAYSGLRNHISSHHQSESLQQSRPAFNGLRAPVSSGKSLSKQQPQLDVMLWNSLQNEPDSAYPNTWSDQATPFHANAAAHGRKRPADDAFQPGFANRMGYTN